MIEISDTIKKLAKKYKVKVKRETTYCNKNTGASIRNEIFLGEFDNEEMEILVFFHELAHIKDNLIMKNRDNYFCIMSKED